MDGEALALHRQLRKIPLSPSPPTEEALEETLCMLWDTRKTGLSSLQKSTVQSLLGIQSPQDLDPVRPLHSSSYLLAYLIDLIYLNWSMEIQRTHQVLACLRSIVRNSLNFNLAVTNINSDGDGNDDGIGTSNFQKLLPPDTSVYLQTTLTLLLKKHHSLWKKDLERTTTHISAASSQSTDFQQEDDMLGIGRHQTVPSTADTLLNDDNMKVLPYLKSMTWTMERTSAIVTTNRTAIITVKVWEKKSTPTRFLFFFILWPLTRLSGPLFCSLKTMVVQVKLQRLSFGFQKTHWKQCWDHWLTLVTCFQNL